MKRIHNILLAAIAFALVGCIEDINTDKPSGEIGDEVQFGLSLPNPETKTLYGIEAGNKFPIYWVNGDKVKVYAPNCLAGRNNEEYAVTVPTGSNQNFAEKLTPTGANGVQWGASENVTFYSIYPSNNVIFAGDEGSATATLNIPSTQSLTHTLVSEEKEGETYGVYYAADMNSVVMYAQTTAPKGTTVNLKYIPYSTVIEFDLGVDIPENIADQNPSLIVESLTLTAAEDVKIVGTFDFKFSDQTISQSQSSNNSSSITLQFATQPELNKTNTTLRAKMCLMPISSVTSLEGWKVSVTYREPVTENGTTTNKRVTKTLTLDRTDGLSTELTAGKVHKIKLPLLTATGAWVYTPGNWMPQIPEYEDVYITELSIPGAWYAGTKTAQGYQATQSFTELWSKGVRAFGAECRSYTPRLSLQQNPTRVCLSGNGSDNNGAYTHQFLQENAMIYISEVISDIATEVAKTDEFAVLVLNYAYGGKGGYRPKDYEFFLNGIQGEIEESGATNIVSDISTNTTIGDVKGKLIIKVNVDSRVSYACSDVNAMFSTVPLIQDLDVTSIYYSDLSYGSWTEGANAFTNTPVMTDKSFLWCFTSANRTQTDSGTASDLPTYAQRKNALEAMMKHSKEIYNKSEHNVWFYFNCGGTETETADADGSGTAFATEMNDWLFGVIKRKIEGGIVDGQVYASDPSSLGIVMFNQCTGQTTKNGVTTKGEDIIRAIIEMNNKFPLKKNE